MSVTVEKMYQVLKDKYQLKLISGEKGIHNMVQWMSVIDNNDVIPYMRATELAVTTGFAIKNETELLQTCILLQEQSVSGFIINIGPYISEIPESVIDYCKSKKFPLFSLPWEVRLIDIINEIDQLMIYSSHMKENIAEIFKDYIFSAELKQERKDILEKNGFREIEKYQMLLFEYKADEINNTLEVPIESIHNDVEKSLNLYHERYVIISHYDQLIVLIIDKNHIEMKRIIETIHEMILKKYNNYNIFMLMGPKNMEFLDIGRYYKDMDTALLLAKRTKQNYLFYDELDIYKLLLVINHTTVLKDYYNDILGRLDEYDKINQTDSITYLKQYMSLNGGIQNMAKENFVHRNTITYNLKKIEKIIDLNLEDWSDRLKIQICLLIHDLL
ncbi:DNA-binding transcriptional regulator, PucR family [[Clostridium] fimetarium]|uniref:DNA-binding transcriptional regulator, PucR family n=1 Tax=[Clostridium] fimetarium TaxID=99656 RepID=A0A1I0RSW2_9FIRM|nr:DNA-binding transcriptional regulator, PucR family [[Clostridium] fimetarium]